MADPGSAVIMSANDTRSEESLLLDHVRRIERSRAGTYSVHIHLSELRASYLQPHYMRVAARAFDDVSANFEVILYVLANADMVLICRETPVEEVDEPLLKVRALFSEDPLTMGEEGDLDDEFTSWYDLTQPSDYATFLKVAEDLADDVAAGKSTSPGPGSGMQTMPGEDLTPVNLAAINRSLERADVADLIRDQTAIVVDPGGTGELLFREHYISMFDLQQRIAADVNLFSNPWLFQYLTETLDRKIMGILGNLDFSLMEDAISINLNVSTVLSQGFQIFHKEVDGNASKVVIEMQTIDIFADMEAYSTARDWLREHGYRVLIDGLNPLSLQFFDPALMDADFTKIGWSSEFLRGLPINRMIEMRDIVSHTDRERVIMARVDSEDAVKWGLELGIRRYQGHFVDTIVEAMVLKGII